MKNFAALRVVIVGVVMKSRVSPAIPYMQGFSLKQQSLSVELPVIQNKEKGNLKQVSDQEALVIVRTSLLQEVASPLALLENCVPLSGVLNTTCR